MYMDGNLPTMGDMMGPGRRSESDEQNYGRWTSDEDAQTKRKAQNRAAYVESHAFSLVTIHR